jgi:DNA-binding beta-propeller fold protein YncE
MATSADGTTWQLAAAPPIGGGDPGAVRTRDGGWVVVITSEPVRGLRRGAADGGPPEPPGGRRFQSPQREPGGPRRGFNKVVPGSEAAPQHYCSVNADSDFTPRRGGVAAPGGPAPMRLMIATSPDGLKFERQNLIVTDQGAVPDLVVDAHGWVWLYYQSCTVGDEVNKIALALSKDGGKSWTFRRVTLSGFSQPKPDPCDPEIQLLPDGTFRLYVTWAEGGRSAHTFLAESGDGVSFRFVGSAFDPGAEALDPSIVKIGDVWHIFCGGGRGPDENWHGTSRDGRSFAADRPMRFTTDGFNFMMANGLAVPGGARFHGFNNPRPGQPTHRIASFFTRDGATWTADAGARLEAGGLAALEEPGFGVQDPAIGRLKDGSYLMVYTTRIPGTRTQRAAHELLAPGQQEDRPPLDAAAPRREIRVERVASKYAVAPAAKAGRFATGQDADLMLGGFGFNNTGGPLRFNHPTGLATDGKALLMTDRWNNRVLVWKTAPAKNTPPDLVLGQPDFTQNNPGTGRHQLNWPGNVAITPDGSRIAVADTHNDRILIWNSFPSKNGTAADLVLELEQFPERGGMIFGWPWGVWTDGRKLAAVATHGSAVLIWNSLPTHDNQPPDLVLRPRNAGTPRNVTSDGAFFAVSDHNHGERSRPGTMVWRAFPTRAAQEPDFTWGEWLKGTFTPDRKLIMAGIRSIYIWDAPPRDNQTDAAVVLRPDSYRNGDGPDAVVAGGRLYVCNYNGNNVLAWNSIPARDDQPPDFALGSDTPAQDTWAENFFIQNPVVATDGRSLFVTSDFDRKLFVWRSLPDESAAKPDLVFHLPEGPWDNALHGSTLALAGKQTIYVWKKLPLNGEPPDIVLSHRIGSVELGELTGVAFDDKYFYLSDRRSGSIHVWEGIPTPDREPKFTLSMHSPGRLTSDGNYLCAAPFEGSAIHLWRVSDLAAGAQAIPLGGRGRFNLPSECLIADGRLFVCNRSFNRVDVWHRLEDALDGRPADAFLGASDEQDRKPGIGRRKLFMPGSLAWGGGYLWVGEFKFSTRILRFSPQSR